MAEDVLKNEDTKTPLEISSNTTIEKTSGTNPTNLNTSVAADSELNASTNNCSTSELNISNDDFVSLNSEEEEVEEDDPLDSEFFVDVPVSSSNNNNSSIDFLCQTENKSQQMIKSAENSFIGKGSAMAIQRIMNDLKKIVSEISENPKLGFSVRPVEDNLFKWHVELSDFDAESPLAEDLAKTPTGKIKLFLLFPQDYPMEPPFLRVISPKFQFRTGFITSGGAICMQVLTASGWTAAYDISSLLIQIKAGMIEGGARIDLTSVGEEYSELEAFQSFERVARGHGWSLQGMKLIQSGKKKVPDEDQKALNS